MPRIGIPRTTRCPHCGRVHDFVQTGEFDRQRCAGCERIFDL